MKKDDIYFCFKYRCKRCPKAKECEEKEKIVGDNNGKRKEFKAGTKREGSERTG